MYRYKREHVYVCYLFGKPAIIIILSNMLWYVNSHIYSNLL